VTPSLKLVYQQGTGTGCQSNTRRIAGLAFLGAATSCVIDTNASPWAARTGDNVTYVYPNNRFVAGQLYSLMQSPGYAAYPTAADQFSLMTYYNSRTIGPGDTIVVYTVISTMRDGKVSDFESIILRARQWFANNIKPNCGCCVGLTGNVDCDATDGVDISDLSALIDNLYISFTPLCCPNEANTDGQPGIDISDLSALIDYLYITFTPTAACH